MRQPFELDFSTAEIASVFATCASCFKYALDEAPSAEERLRLSVIRLRFTRWGEAVSIYKESGPSQDYIDLGEVDHVKETLVKIIALFESSYMSIQEPAQDLTSNHPTNEEQRTQTLLILKTIASERSQGKSLLYSRPSGFGAWHMLPVSHALKLVDELENNFSAGPEQSELYESERKRFRTAGLLDYLHSVADEIDPLIRDSRAREMGFRNVIVLTNDDVVGAVCNLSSEYRIHLHLPLDSPLYQFGSDSS